MAKSIRNDWFQSSSPLISSIDFKSMDYVLLPARRVVINPKFVFYPSRAVLALPRDGVVIPQRLYVAEFERGFGNVNVREFTDLNVVSRKDQAFYCLLTPRGDE